MLCWCQRAAYSIIFTMRHVVGRLYDGTKLALRHARNVICKCAVSLCCCHAVFHCSLALNLSAVQSTLKVRLFYYCYFHFCARHSLARLWHEFIRDKCGVAVGKELYHSIYFPFVYRHFSVDLSNVPKSTLTTFFIYSLDTFQFIFELFSIKSGKNSL